VARWYFPPEVDYRLSLLHPDAKGLVVWVLEAKVSRCSELINLFMTYILLNVTFACVPFSGSVQG
jgi:hypothetical protein